MDTHDKWKRDNWEIEWRESEEGVKTGILREAQRGCSAHM